MRSGRHLIAAVTSDMWSVAQADLGAGKGGELRRKFYAAYSSAALVVNTFAPMTGGVHIPDVGFIEGAPRFEVGCSAGTQGWKPTLDVVVANDKVRLLVESKCC